MTRREAEALITKNEGRLCVHFYRRADGTVLTDNCPVGLRALRRRASRIASAFISAVVGFFSGFGLNLMFSGADGGRPPQYHTVGVMVASEEPHAPVRMPQPEPVAVMGELSEPLRPAGDGWVKGKMMPVGRETAKQRRAGK
jgi:hypothetical protein